MIFMTEADWNVMLKMSFLNH